MNACKHTQMHTNAEETNANFNDMKFSCCHRFFIQALYDEDDPENPFRKVGLSIPKLRRMPKTISEFAKGVLIRYCYTLN